MTERRQLRFETLDDAVVDARHLLAVGYDKLGNWDLDQCCQHLTMWMSYQIDGYPPTPLLVRPLLALVRMTKGRSMAKKLLDQGEMKPGLPTIPQSVPKNGGQDAEAVEDLAKAVHRFKEYNGSLLPSPLLGELDRDDWDKVHRIHAAHHLGYLIPKG